MVFIFHNYPLELFMFKIRNYTSNWCNKSSEIVEKFLKNCDKLHPYLAELGVIFPHPLGLTVNKTPIYRSGWSSKVMMIINFNPRSQFCLQGYWQPCRLCTTHGICTLTGWKAMLIAGSPEPAGVSPDPDAIQKIFTGQSTVYNKRTFTNSQ